MGYDLSSNKKEKVTFLDISWYPIYIDWNTNQYK